MPLNNMSIQRLQPATVVRLAGPGANRNLGLVTVIAHHSPEEGRARLNVLSHLGTMYTTTVPDSWIRPVQVPYDVNGPIGNLKAFASLQVGSAPGVANPNA